MSTTTWVFVPISIIGCGKSTIFRALTRLYPNFAHIENDRLDGKRAFIARLQHAVKDHQVVLIDRNNHMRRHRAEIAEILQDFDVKLVLLNFIDPKMDLTKVKNIARDRIKARGTNHPTVDGSDNRMTNMVLGSFFRDFTPYDPIEEGSLFSEIVNLDMAKPVYSNLDVLMNFLSKNVGLPHPDSALAHEVVQSVMEYQVPEEEKKFKKPKPRRAPQGGRQNGRPNGIGRSNGAPNGNKRSQA